MCDSRLALVDRHSLRLGGQHGEEGEEGEIGRQENGKEVCEKEDREAEVNDGRTRRSRRRPGQTLVAYADNVEERPAPNRYQAGRRLIPTKRASVKTRSAFQVETFLPNGSLPRTPRRRPQRFISTHWKICSTHWKICERARDAFRWALLLPAEIKRRP